MGANGSYASGVTNTEEGRNYKTVDSIGDNIKIIELKNPKSGVKLPEESHTPGRIYVAIEKDGKDVKAIAEYGIDGKKLYEIHTGEHYGLSPHYHLWKNGGPLPKNDPSYAQLLIAEMEELLENVRKLKL